MSNRIEEQVEQNYTAIQTLINNAKQLHELPSITAFEDDDRFLVQIDSTRESVSVTFKELISYIEVAAATFKDSASGKPLLSKPLIPIRCVTRGNIPSETPFPSLPITSIPREDSFFERKSSPSISAA